MTSQLNQQINKNMTTKQSSKQIFITPPKFAEATFEIVGTAPLVIHRFSTKAKNEMLQKMETGRAAKNTKVRDSKNGDDAFNEARYISKEGWDGFNAASIRNAMIRAAGLSGAVMTAAKCSLFVVADGWDAKEMQIPLVRIYGEAKRQDDIARVANGSAYVTIRAAYYNWAAKVRIRWDTDQFTDENVLNILARAGIQVGIGEGRPFSKDSAGMGWGTFEIKSAG